MHITLGTEVAFNIHADVNITYSDVETALLDAGFTDYTIQRSTGAGYTDIALSVRSADRDENNNLVLLDAEPTMDALSAAINALVGEEPTP